jgi:hypothetical protein
MNIKEHATQVMESKGIKKGMVFQLGDKGRVEIIEPEIYKSKSGDLHNFDRIKVKLLDQPERYADGVCYVWPRDLTKTN